MEKWLRLLHLRISGIKIGNKVFGMVKFHGNEP